MKREIKFRAWDNLDKRMITHEQEYIPVRVTSFGVLRLNPHHKEGFWEFQDEDRFELMQFTGLKDKNGVDIFESDIIKGNHKDLFIIESINGGLQLYNIRYFGQPHNELIAEATCNAQTKRWLEESEVVGNVIQNPELL